LNPGSSAYAALFLEESLGLAQGTLRGDGVPRELAEMLADSVRGSESSASPEPFLEQRVLRFLEELEQTLLDRDGFLLRKARWPHGVGYATCLTHDVDNISRPLGHLLKVRKRFSSADQILAVLGLKSLYDNIAYVASLEDQRKLRSSFYFLTHNYDLARLSPELRGLRERGWDIGLHGDFGTHTSQDGMAEAVSRFRAATGFDPKGVREHFLQFEFGTTWEIVEGAGLDYDTTVGNRDELGFRLGLCTPFHPPDRDWRPMRVIELPLVLMDTTLWGYLGRSEEEGKQDVVDFKNKVAGVGGLFTVLWHQEAARMKGGRIYPWLLDRIAGDGCFIGSASVIADWWSARGRPMLHSGTAYSMEEAPRGLQLKFKAKEERKISVDGGRVEVKGTEASIAVDGESFRVRVG
jgi:hypothetical protein